METVAEKSARLFKTYSDLSHQDLVVNAVGVALLAENHQAKVAELEKDASRYRQARKSGVAKRGQSGLVVVYNEVADAATDAAIAAYKQS